MPRRAVACLGAMLLAQACAKGVGGASDTDTAPGGPVDTVVTAGGDTLIDGGGTDAPIDTDPHPRIVAVSRGSTLPDLSGYPPPIGADGTFLSGFGPRRLHNEGDRDDFHLGFDYVAAVGVPVLALADGEVHDARAPGTPNDGYTLYLRHPLPTPFLWQGETIDAFWAVYSHLSGFAVATGDPVRAGQVVAYVGNTGVSHGPHLHLELRLGTQCTLRYLHDNPTSTCGLGFDPEVNPYHFLAGSQPGGMTVTVTSESPYTVRVSTPDLDLDLNRIETDLGTIDFDLRTGMDATTFDALDQFDHGWVEIDPDRRTDEPTLQSWNLVFPTRPAYVEVLDFRGDGWRITP